MGAAARQRDITIIGATGFVGRRLVDVCLDSRPALKLSILVRDSRDPFVRERAARLTAIRGDLSSKDPLNGLMSSGGTVVNLAFIAEGSLEENLAAARNLVTVCQANGIKRLIHVSSVAVYGNVAGDDVNEESPCRPRNRYQQIKYRIEQLLVAEARGNFELVILRPSAVFGANGKNLLKLACDLLHGRRVLNYLKACLFYHRRLNLVALENVVTAIVFMIDRDLRDSPEVFIVSDDDQPGNHYRYVENKLMTLFKVRPYPIPVIPIPVVFTALVLKLFRRGENNPRRRYLNDRLRGLGYLQPLSLDQGLMAFADWYSHNADTI